LLVLDVSTNNSYFKFLDNLSSPKKKEKEKENQRLEITQIALTEKGSKPLLYHYYSSSIHHLFNSGPLKPYSL
jgi:hypothetical protein